MVNKSEWLTITELSESTRIADSTVRRYLHTFSVFFKHDGNLRGKRYDKNAIKILNRIRELYEKGYDNKKVHSFLDEEFPPIFDNVDEISRENNHGNSHENNHEDSEKSPFIAISREDVEEIKKALAEQKMTLDEQRVIIRALLESHQKQNQTIERQGETIQQLVEDLEKHRLLIVPKEVAATTVTEEVDEVQEDKEETPPKKKGFFNRIFGR